MRHHNPTSVSYFSSFRNSKVVKPYYSQYIHSYEKNGFKFATSKKRYVKILQYIADHDGCKRVDIIRDVYGRNANVKDSYCRNKSWYRSIGSTVFSQLLYIDVIDYDKNFCYHITDHGRKVLKNAYLNDCLKHVMKNIN